MPTEDLKKILSHYPIDVISIKNENYKVKKGVWWIETSKGYKILKKNSIPKEKLEFIIAAIEYLANNGINMPKIIESKDGKKYVEIDGANYMLNEAIEGVAPSSKTPNGQKRIVTELGKFHAASKGFQPPTNCNPSILLGTFENKVSKKMKKLNEYYLTEKNNNSHSEFGEIILKEFPYFYSLMERSLKEHNNSYYSDWVNEVKNINCLAHQDFIDGNLILTDSNEIFVLDPDSLSIELPIKDIRKFLNKVMKKRGGWDINVTKNILSWYQEANPLKPCEWEVLKSTIMYPHLFAGIMSKYYQKRETSWQEAKYVKKLKDVILIEKSKEPVFNNFDKIISSL